MPVTLRNCPGCGRLLTTPAGTPCPWCREEEDRAVDRIQAYLEAGGAPSMGAISQTLGLRLSLLRRLVGSGRLELGGAGEQTRRCAFCQRPLAQGTSGHVCAECARQALERGGVTPGRPSGGTAQGGAAAEGGRQQGQTARNTLNDSGRGPIILRGWKGGTRR